MSEKSDRPTTTPRTDRHHAYDSPRRICGYAAPSGGSAARSTTGGGVLGCLQLSANCDFGRGGGTASPARTAGLPDRLRAPEAFPSWTGGGFFLGTVSPV